MPFIDFFQKKVIAVPEKKYAVLNAVKSGDFTRVFNNLNYQQKFMIDDINKFLEKFTVDTSVTPSEISNENKKEFGLFVKKVIEHAVLELLDETGNLKSELISLLELDKLADWNNPLRQNQVKRELIQAFCTEPTISSVIAQLAGLWSRNEKRMDVLEVLGRELINYFPSKGMLHEKEYTIVKNELDKNIYESILKLFQNKEIKQISLETSREIQKENVSQLLANQLDNAYDKFISIDKELKQIEAELKLFGKVDQKVFDQLRRSYSEKVIFLKNVLNTDDINEIYNLMRERNKNKTLNPEFIPGKSPLSLVTKLPSPETAKNRGKYNLLKLAKLGLLQQKGRILNLKASVRYGDFLEKIKRFTVEERQKYRVIIKNGDVLKAKDHKTYNSSQNISHNQPGFVAYVINPNGEFLLFDHLNKKDKVAHSSLFAGASVFAAGEMKIDKGQITAITLNSGHYKPQLAHVYHVIKYLKEQGVDISDIKIIFRYEPPKSHYKLNPLFNEFRTADSFVYSALEIYDKYKDNEHKLNYSYRSIIEEEKAKIRLSPIEAPPRTPAVDSTKMLNELLKSEEGVGRAMTPEDHKELENILNEDKTNKGFQLTSEAKKILDEKDSSEPNFTSEDFQKILDEKDDISNEKSTFRPIKK